MLLLPICQIFRPEGKGSLRNFYSNTGMTHCIQRGSFGETIGAPNLWSLHHPFEVAPNTVFHGSKRFYSVFCDADFGEITK